MKMSKKIIGFGILMVVCIALVGTTSAGISNGLIGYWPLDEGSGTTAADLIGGNSGILSGNASFVASEKSGLPGYAISLTGGSGQSGDHVKISDGWDAQQIPSQLMPTTAVSVSAWANYSTGTYGGVFWNCFFTGGTRSGYGIYGRSTSNGFRWFIPTVGNTSNEGGNYLTYLGTSPNTWYHVVGTYDGATGTAVLYINGQPEATSNSLGSTIDWDPIPYNCLIGRYDDDNESFGFQGKIDDVAVWNRALTPAEVTYLYNNGDGNPPVEPIVDVTPDSVVVSEDGATDSYEIVLLQEPNQPTVTITATPEDTGQIQVNSGNSVTLTFTPSNWDTAQTITVSAVDDELNEGSHSSNINHIAVSADSSYDGTFVPPVKANIEDNDVPGVTVEESAGSTDVAEGGAGDSYTVVLDTEPNATILITIDVDDLVVDETTVNSGGSLVLTFTTSNWDTPQTVDVAAVQDGQEEGDHASLHTFVVSGGNVFYGDMTVGNLWVNITDDEAFTGAPVGQWEFDVANTDVSGRVQNDSAGDFNAYLDYDTAIKTPTLFEKAGTDYHYLTTTGQDDPNYVIRIFGISDKWHYLPAQDITVEAWLSSDILDGYYSGVIGCLQNNGAFERGWGLYVNDTSFGWGVSTDDHNNSLHRIWSDSIEAEKEWHHVVGTYDGATANLYVDGQLAGTHYNLAQRSGPTLYSDAPFVLSKNEDDDDNWIFEGRLQEVRMYNYALDAATIMDHYVTMPPGSMVTIDENGSVDVDEEGSTTDSYTVVLDIEPSAGSDVNVTVKPPADLDVGAGAGVEVTLTFTNADWNTAQTVTVTAVDDDELEYDEVATIKHVISSTGDADYNESGVRNVYVNVADNECGVWGFSTMDFNGDCYVDLIDYAEFAQAWADCTLPYEAGCVDQSPQ